MIRYKIGRYNANISRQKTDSLPKCCNFPGVFMWPLASFRGRAFFFSSRSSFLSGKEAFWFMMNLNLRIPVTLEEIPRDLRLWWPGVPVHLKSLYNSTQNLLAVAGTAPSIIYGIILAVGWLSGGVYPLVFHLACTIWYEWAQRPGVALDRKPHLELYLPTFLCLLCFPSPGHRAARCLPGHWIPPPPENHHPIGEGLRPCALRGEVRAGKHLPQGLPAWRAAAGSGVNVCPMSPHRPWIKDRFMAPDIEAAHRLLVEQKVSAGFWLLCRTV